MMSAFIRSTVLVAAITSSAHATGIRVSDVRAERGPQGPAVTATITWKNGWRNARNHDAAWVFVKLRTRGGGDWTHARVLGIATNTATPRTDCRPTQDRIGAFCAPAAAHRGDVRATVSLQIDSASLSPRLRAATELEARVFAIEMVYIPAGPFSVGDPDPKSAEYAAYYASDGSGRHAGTYRITSEAAIHVAPERGALYYDAKTAQYEGDRQGPIPAAFPKGTRAFYAMKYEILQGQYAEFLNTINRQASYFRAPNAGFGYYEERGSIRLTGDRFTAEFPDRPANWISWDDGAAFADWSGLRPMTEFEFTKAARGPAEPVPTDFPWGTSSKARLLRRVAATGDLVTTGAADESRLSDDTREELGASFYWVMDLAGSVWEKVVTPGHPRGRAFLGTHGDGMLRDYGVATNEDWPAGDHESGGYGRGGGSYERERELRGDRDFTPLSPVEWRRYGSWGGAPRSVAYGFRAVRTADH